MGQFKVCHLSECQAIYLKASYLQPTKNRSHDSIYLLAFLACNDEEIHFLVRTASMIGLPLSTTTCKVFRKWLLL